MSDNNTFQFQGKTWRVVDTSVKNVMVANEVPPAKPDVLEELDAEINKLWVEEPDAISHDQGKARATVNAALKLMRQDIEQMYEAPMTRYIQKLEARIAELEKPQPRDPALQELITSHMKYGAKS